MGTTWSAGPAAAKRRSPTLHLCVAAITECCTKSAGRWSEKTAAGSPGRRFIGFRQTPGRRERLSLGRPRSRQFRGRPVHRVCQVLGEILHLELRLGTLGGDPIAEHRQAEGTGRRHPGRLGPQRLLDALVVDALADLLLHPHAAAAGTTAEATLVMALDLDELRARDSLDDRAGRVIDVIPAAEVAGVVVGELAFDGLTGLEPAVFDQAGEPLGMMDAFVCAAELGGLGLD